MRMIELGKRAVACKAWRWMPGMLVFGDPESVPRAYLAPPPPSDPVFRARIQSVVLGRFFGHYDYAVDYPDAEGEPCDSSDFFDPLPDLTDPATVGCLLHLVREAWGDGGAYSVRYKNLDRRSRWLVSSVHLYHSTKHSHGDTEAEALVAALEAANE